RRQDDGCTAAFPLDREASDRRLGGRGLCVGLGEPLADPVQAQGAQVPRAVLGTAGRDAQPAPGDLLLRTEVIAALRCWTWRAGVHVGSRDLTSLRRRM